MARHPIGDKAFMAQKVWLVTGCSTGFGQTLVPAIMGRGDLVIATARRLDDLEYTKEYKNVSTLQLDVTASEEELAAIVKKALTIWGRIDVLVNNAGYVLSGVWEEVTHKQTLQQFETNVFGALKLTRNVLPHMRARGSGVIFFMSSLAAWRSAGAGGPYSSSKAALEGAVESLYQETRHLGIRTHLLVTGMFRTQILNSKNRVASTNLGIADYAEIRKNQLERLAASDGKQPGDPAVAVEKILDIARVENLNGKESRDLPLRILLGSDAIKVLRAKCNETLELLDEWEEFASSTDFSEKTNVPSYGYKDDNESL
ncbi:hypothetical protein BKA61DRAFT_618199 [Leptodontidium sp. MPI-SDFR-AT-0119]|nr:hypothetical protein BKA61DRAFT_618199 [Leptodontidium sp. MPI-SDFR-AT-0119]